MTIPMKKETKKKALTLKTLTKRSVWDCTEKDVLRLIEPLYKANDEEELRHYLNIIKIAFIIENLGQTDDTKKKKYEKLGYTVGKIARGDEEAKYIAISKRPINRVSDLTYENIHHITAKQLLEILDRNFGGGWDSLSQSMKDIIESGFDISTTTLPQSRLHKPGGMYEKKVADGYEVLEVAKGTWVEAIFAMVKPEMEKPKLTIESSDDADNLDEDGNPRPKLDDDNDDDITEDNYRTTFEIESEESEDGEDGEPEE